MGGPDETQARAVLVAMQERLIGGPYVALGVPPSATASEIRTAFLQLTKTYHPARFGYMSTELQRLSNEVFLLLREAHDSIAKPTRGSAKQSDRSGLFPAVAAVASQRPAQATAPPPARPGPTSPPGPPGPQSPRMAPVTGAPPIGGPPRPARMPSPSPSPEDAGDRRIPSRAPSGDIRVAVVRPAAAVVRPGAMARTGSAPGAAGKPDELAPILEQMQRGQWEAARTALAALAAKAPDTPRYRALICYARGREAQLAQRVDEARVELQDALQIDPELQLAKTALAELFTRRK